MNGRVYGMKLILRVEMAEPESDSDTDPGTPIESVLGEFSREVESLEPALAAIEAQIASIDGRMRRGAPKSWLETPLKAVDPAVKAWCKEKGLASGFTVAEWFRAVLRAAIVCDLETRSISFAPEEARLFANGRPIIGLFEFLRNSSKWFSPN